MTADDPRLQQIWANVDFVFKEFAPLSDIDFGLDLASVAWMEGYIERMGGEIGGENGDMCFPFAKVRKQFEQGLEGR